MPELLQEVVTVFRRFAIASILVLTPGSAPGAAIAPVVPGFARFYALPESDAVAGGRLLLGELKCTSCHAADESVARLVPSKAAPDLTGVGARVQPEYLRRFLSDPHGTKPGTTMPDMLNGVGEDRANIVEALVHFLASTGSTGPSMPLREAARRGERLFHQVGCVACHQPQSNSAEPWATSVPLGDPAAKYTLRGLAAFLENPLDVRPSGRMPHLNLNSQEALDVATWFFRDVEITPNMDYEYYEGRWNDLPDFAQFKPKAQGATAGFDLQVARRGSNYGVRFRGYLHVAAAGEYNVILGSDDGSALWIGGEQVVNNDGIHPYTTQSGRVRLEAGAHPVRVEFFQQAGGAELTVEIEGPDLPRQPLAALVTRSPDDEGVLERFIPDPARVAEGRRFFATSGCATCHRMEHDGKVVEPTSKPMTALVRLAPQAGCLSVSPPNSLNLYPLSPRQRECLTAAINDLRDRAHSRVAQAELDVPTRIHETLVRMNCYACHERGKIGGPEAERNELFTTTIPEMGDEGRIPPALDGAGDKLRPEWLQHLFDHGARDRPYMRTRMPRFGRANLGELAEWLAAVDARTEAPFPEVDEPEYRLKSTGRHLVGDAALSCIKCHNFERYRATGIQAIDLTTMAKRLRPDWFHRYLLDPQQYRRGTRMPAAWPFGQATIRDRLDGDAHKQIYAVWSYLSDGTSAAVPSGLIRESIELKPKERPIIYRNFIAEAGARAIAVGYPEGANLAFDAENPSLALIWHGRFLDASMHWVGRGSGFQEPLGDHVVRLPRGMPFAQLDDAPQTWPAGTRERGVQFRGYRLDQHGRPTFDYELGGLRIAETPAPMPQPDRAEPALRRTFQVAASEPGDTVYYRAAVAGKLENLGDAWYAVDGAWQMRVLLNNRPARLVEVPAAGGQSEWRMAVPLSGGTAEIIHEYRW